MDSGLSLPLIIDARASIVDGLVRSAPLADSFIEHMEVKPDLGFDPKWDNITVTCVLRNVQIHLLFLSRLFCLTIIEDGHQVL